jgi:superfamily II DNA or RNA helicase
MVNSILNQFGYNVLKSSLTQKELKKLEQDLTVEPGTESFAKENNSFKVYQENDKYMTIPKYFGSNKFGQINFDETNLTKSKFSYIKELRDYQISIVQKCIDHMTAKGGGILCVPCGRGKCLRTGTLVMMYDGSTKKVEDIKIGEQLMGDDSTPRTVLSLAHGQEEMFDIISRNGEKYTVNKSHVLSLKHIWAKPNDKIYNITVSKYNELSNRYKSAYVGYRVPIFFKYNEVSIDPYFLGLWIGCKTIGRLNGKTTGKIKLPNADEKTIKYIKDNENKIKSCEYLQNEFKREGLMHNSDNRIPLNYKCNSRDIQLKILAGFIDALGKVENKYGLFQIIHANEKLLDDIIFLARSIGFDSYKIKYTNRKSYTKYFRIIIYGDGINKIPTLLSHKQIKHSRCYGKLSLKYKINVKSVGQGEYYGFEIDGNKLFVLGDFSVTHNTAMSLYIAAHFGLKTLVLVNKSCLQDQWVDRVKQFTNASIGTIRQDKIDIEGKDIVIGMLQSISMKDYDLNIFKQFGLLIVDETHHVVAKVFSQALFKVCCKYTLGLSATPDRKDGTTHLLYWFLGDMIHRESKRIDKRVSVKIFNYITINQLFIEKKQWMPGANGGGLKPSTVIMTNNLCKLKERTIHLINIITLIIMQNPHRKILLLSGRKSHLCVLKNNVDKFIKIYVEQGKIIEGEIKTSYYIGDMNAEERKVAETSADILFATYSLAQEGLDIERLNTIILATPQSDVEQAVGRIMRKITTEEDIRPLIIDFADTLSSFKNQTLKRKQLYTKNKYQIDEYYLNGSNLISAEQYYKLLGFEPNKKQIYNPKLDKVILDIDNKYILDEDEDEDDDQNNNDNSSDCSDKEYNNNKNKDSDKIIVIGSKKNKTKGKTSTVYELIDDE